MQEYVHVWRNTATDKLHRDDDLPAVIYPNGDRFWYQNGALHRINGPAFIGSNGYAKYYLHGYKHSKEHYDEIVDSLKQLSRNR